MISGHSADYINIHSHKPVQNAGQVTVLNLSDHFEQVSLHPLVSIGLHPWYISRENPQKVLSQIREYAIHPHVIAIGECGLDLLIDVPLLEQEFFFRDQILLAESLRKPLIIHCVKAFNELIRIKKEMDVTVPMIIHGFNNNAAIAGQLQQHGFYLSFGKALLKHHSPAISQITQWPAERLFLETDDADTDISRIFEAAAACRQTSPEALRQQIFKNFKHVFLHE
ncbi:MAG: TatD family hydrolase [Bacteroidetes bacterium]|nr:TatD family hydrolase [Bacteroidota bacterium]